MIAAHALEASRPNGGRLRLPALRRCITFRLHSGAFFSAIRGTFGKITGTYRGRGRAALDLKAAIPFPRERLLEALVVCPTSGAQGGQSASGDDGGLGGDAGAITLTGGTLNPAPSQSVQLYEIRGFPPGGQMLTSDDNCLAGRIAIGDVVEARAAGGEPLYRLRFSLGTSLLGGHGGIPGGGTVGGVVGAYGTSAPLKGLPVQ